MIDGGTGGEARPARSRVVRALLGFPLFYKILVANAAIVAAITLACAAVSSAGDDSVRYALLLGGGMVLSILSNAVILKLALSPLSRLEQAAERVQRGDLAARAEPSPLADRNMDRLTATFNGMLDSAEAYRLRLREIAAHALRAQEEERKRIARELHDGTAQTLAALRVRLRVARNTEDEASRAQQLERLSAELGEATEEIRTIAMNLRPPALDMLGLAPAIESHARSVGETAGLNMVVELTPVAGLLTPDAELALYRIVQEALSNAARHSGAHTVRVRLSTAARAVVATVEDDGRGFDVTREMSSGGLGLFGMQERGGYVGAAVNIESEPSRGTRVRVTIPVVETARYA